MLVKRNTFILWILVIIPIALSFFSKLEVSKSISFAKYTEEFLLLLLYGAALKGVRRIFASSVLVWLFVFFVGYLVIGFVSSVKNDSSVYPVILQLMISLKFIYVLSVLIGIDQPISWLKTYLRAAKIILVLSILLILWQFVFPSIYDVVFSNGYHKGTIPYSGGRLPRGAGVFTHPGQMAVFAGTLTIYLFYIYTNKRTEVTANVGAWLLVSFIALALTFSRLEIAATVVSVIVTFFVVDSRKNRSLKYVLSFIAIVVSFFAVQPALDSIYKWLVGDSITDSSDPRIVFLAKGVEIANAFFPFGSGLGTYGGYVAAITDSSLYLDYGFDKYSWYLQGSFLADTFWAHVLGEAGYLGLLMYFLALASILIVGRKCQKYGENAALMGKMAIAGTVFIGINSFATPDLVSVISLGQCFMAMAYMAHTRNVVLVKHGV